MREPGFVEQFLKDVATHRLEILRDDGLYRHLRFRRVEADGYVTGCMGFDIVTWPGWLAYSGDMGAFMFTRLPDMLQFFRKEPREGRTIFDGIDRRYWAEKCEAEGARGDGIQEFSWEKFVADVKDYHDQACQVDAVEEDDPDFIRDAAKDQKKHRDEVWSELESELNSMEQDEARAYQILRDFSHDGFRFDDWERDSKVYTQRFNWCCCALAWAISKYDEAKAQQASAQPLTA